NNITAIHGIDTRKLTLKIRKFGPKKATIAFNKNNNHDLTHLLDITKELPSLENLDLTQEVTCKKSYQWVGNKLWNTKGYEIQKNQKYNIVAIDYGIKTNILRNFSE
ncbi:MAG: carbamoyl phosphate synthase small subunit, partial [Candidatus Fonsibacter sp.]